MDSQATAGPSSRQLEGEEIDVEWLSLIKTNHDVNVRLSDRIPLDGLPQECNLLAVSSIWGLVIVGTANSVQIYRLSEIQGQLEGATKDATPAGTPIQTISLPARPIWVRLAMHEEQLIVYTANGTGLHVFRLSDVLRGHIAPYHSFTSNIPSHLIDLLPNPAVDAPSRYVALLAREGMVLADIEEKKLLNPVAGPFTSGCWSAKGKQIVLGTPDGRLVQYTPEGVAKAEIPPPSLKSPSYPSSVQWLDTHLFLVSYAPVNGRPDASLDVFVISRNKSEITYTKFYDPLNTIGVRGRSGAFRYYAGLKNWGDQTKHLGFLMSGLASEVAVMHGTMEGSGVPSWEALILDERARGIMPVGKKGISEDTSCIGMELDLTSTKAIRRGIVGGIEQPDLPPAPRLLVYSQNGVVISFDIQNSNGSGYPGMIVPRDILAVEGGDDDGMASGISTPGTITPTPASTNQPSAFSGFGSSLNASFGAPSPPASQPTSSAFAQTQSSAFGGSSGAFGNSNQSSGSAFSGFGQTSTTPASTPSKPVSAFGSSASPFGQQSTTPSSTPAKASAFGQSSTSSSTGFGAFGPSSGFGQSSTATAASTTPLSTPAKAVGFGQSGFGQSPAPSSSSAFGAPAFGAKPSFGQISNPTGFGQSAFGQPPSAPAASAFGNISTPSSGGFGAFGNTKPAASNTGFGVNTSSFGAKPNGFGGSGFGGGSAFGASSGFGQSAFGQPSVPAAPKAVPQPATGGFAGFGPQATSSGAASFGGFGQKSAPSPSPTPPPASSGGDFGLDSFASALESSSKPAVPGLQDDSPPTSPIIGARKPGGMDEYDSPPNSPPPSQPKQPQQQVAPQSSAPSFIKPATAFGGIPSAFAGFGQAAAKPAASEPAKPAPSAPAAFGGTGLGQSSKPVAPTAFGSSAFGQSSKPVAGAFGQTTAHSTGGFANISGGFGGFAAKSTSNTTASTPSTGGFAGFGPGAGSKPTSSTGGFGAAAISQSGSGGGGFGALLSQKSEVKPGGSAFGAGSGFGGGKETSQTQTDSKSYEPIKEAETTKISLSDIPISPPKSSSTKSDSETEAEGYVVPEPAIIPSGYDRPSSASPAAPSTSSAGNPSIPILSSSPSPEVEEAVLPAGYDTPTPTPQPDLAIIPAGYGTCSSTDIPASSEPPVVAKETALPEHSATEEAAQEMEEAAEVPLPEQSVATPESVVDEDEEGVVVSAPEIEDAGAVIDNRERTVFANSVWVTGEVEEDEEEVEDDGYYDGEGEESGVYEEEEEDEQVDEEGSEEEEDLTPESSEGEDEAEAEAEEEDDTETVKPTTSSTPAWFADPPTSTAPESPESTATASSTPSSTPAPDQAKSQTNKFSFASRYAARTASPLGSQPPQTPQDTATPPLSPTKPERELAPTADIEESSASPTKPTTSLFGGKSEAKPLFGLGTGRPSSSSSSTPALEEKVKQEKGEPAASAFNFGAPKSEPVSTAPAEQKPFGSFGFGLGQPPAAVAASSTKSPFNFAPSQLADKGQVPPQATPSLFGAGSGSTPPTIPSKLSNSFFAPAPVSATIIPPKPEQAVAKSTPPPPPMSTFIVPARQTISPVPQRKEDDKATMAAVLEGMILDLKAETKHLQDLLGAAEKHHTAMKEANFVKVEVEELENHKALPFSSVKDTSAIADSLLKQLKDWKSQDTGVERKLAELQSLLLKTDMRSGQLEQFAKARDDPSVVKVIEVTQLSAQQLSDQSRINKAVQAVETGLEDLEMGLEGLKRRVEDVSNGITPGSATVERLEKSIKNLDGTIQERQRTLDDLSKRFQSIDLPSSPSRATPKRPSSQYISFATPTAPISPTKRIPLPVPSDILSDVKSAINDDPVAGLADRLKGRKTRLTTASSATRSSLFSHSAKSVLEIDSIPVPVPLPSRPEPTRKSTKPETPSADPVIKEEEDKSSSPSPASPSPFSAFSGITFSLDPGPIASSLPRSGGGSSRGGGSNRQHAPAAKLDMSFAPTGNAQASGGFDFALPAPGSVPVKKDGAPSGFFSLSGYVAK